MDPEFKYNEQNRRAAHRDFEKHNTYQKDSVAKIRMQRVESTALSAIGYDLTNQVLAVQFINHDMDGHTYLFRSVPLSVWEAFLEAPSKGKFFQEHIRSNIGPPIDGGYEWNVGKTAGILPLD